MKGKKEFSRIIYDHYRAIWQVCGMATVGVVLLNSFVFNIPNLTAIAFAIYMAIIIPTGMIAKKVDNREKQKLISKLDKLYDDNHL